MDDTPLFTRGDVIFLPDGTTLQTHPESRCAGNACSIHNPSDHPLRDAPQYWDDRFKTIYRLCSHGYVHPDADDFAYKTSVQRLSPLLLALVSAHDCDGCCRWPTRDEDDAQ